MNHKIKIGLKPLLLALLVMMSVAAVFAANTVEPSAPTSITYVSNTTNLYPNGTMLNATRGYIYTYNIVEQAPTIKWIGYVGNITGSYALQDADGFRLYDWTLATTKGEVYATKESSGTDANGVDDGDQGGIPSWTTMECANLGNLTWEQDLFNHTTSTGARANEDSYLATFTVSGGADFTLQSPFYVGESVLIDGTGCYGVDLFSNNTRVSGEFEEVVLMDGTTEDERPSGYLDTQYDLIYASLIENNTWGYRNGTTADFQIMLPQSGLEGAQPNKAFYFYIELI